MVTSTKEEIDLMKTQLHKLAEENKILKEQCQHVESQLDIALLQVGNEVLCFQLESCINSNKHFCFQVTRWSAKADE